MKRIFLILVLLLAVVCIIVGVAMWHNLAELGRYREHIETTYASEIALIEQRAKELPDPDDCSMESITLTDTITSELEGVLLKPEIFSASWSFDGHHGLRGLKPMDTDGYYTLNAPWCVRSSDSSKLHTLYFGTTFLGQELLVYEGRVPNGVNRAYSIAFYRSPIVDGSTQE